MLSRSWAPSKANSAVDPKGGVGAAWFWREVEASRNRRASYSAHSNRVDPICTLRLRTLGVDGRGSLVPELLVGRLMGAADLVADPGRDITLSSIPERLRSY